MQQAEPEAWAQAELPEVVWWAAEILAVRTPLQRLWKLVRVMGLELGLGLGFRIRVWC